MKKTLFLICLIIALTSCSTPQAPEIKKAEKLSMLQTVNDFEYTIIEIDNCEYLAWRSAYGYISVTHKGDCKNIIHKNTSIASNYKTSDYIIDNNKTQLLKAKAGLEVERLKIETNLKYQILKLTKELDSLNKIK
jgi:hypothetical protein